MTKEQMAERIADEITIAGLSRAKLVWVLTELRRDELEQIFEANCTTLSKATGGPQ